METIRKSWSSLKSFSIHTIFDNITVDEFLKLQTINNKQIQKYYFQKLSSSFNK